MNYSWRILHLPRTGMNYDDIMADTVSFRHGYELFWADDIDDYNSVDHLTPESWTNYWSGEGSFYQNC